MFWLKAIDDNFRTQPKNFHKYISKFKGNNKPVTKLLLETKLSQNHNLSEKLLQTTFIPFLNDLLLLIITFFLKSFPHSWVNHETSSVLMCHFLHFMYPPSTLYLLHISVITTVNNTDALLHLTPDVLSNHNNCPLVLTQLIYTFNVFFTLLKRAVEIPSFSQLHNQISSLLMLSKVFL